MKAVSHFQLGIFLAENYMHDSPRRYTRAFILGCVEPDKNPATYFKGSLRNAWLRGHNWDSANRYIQKICRRLERKEQLHLFDYYNLGKLIHYTADAFTYTHNRCFRDGLRAHRRYEKGLHTYFSLYLSTTPCPDGLHSGTAADTIHSYHSDYMARSAGVHTDAEYTVTVCTAVLCKLLQRFVQSV